MMIARGKMFGNWEEKLREIVTGSWCHCCVWVAAVYGSRRGFVRLAVPLTVRGCCGIVMRRGWSLHGHQGREKSDEHVKQ